MTFAAKTFSAHDETTIESNRTSNMTIISKGASASGATAAMGKYSVGSGQKLKSTMRGPTLSTLGENETPNAWNTVGKQAWRSPSVVNRENSIVGKFSQMGIGNRSMDPSNAPGSSQLSVQYKPSRSQVPTQLSVRDDKGRPAQWIKTALCVRSPYQRKSFAKGMILTLPFHVPNLNENATLEDKCLATTIHGPVYSKRRMAVVLWRHATDMICLPLYSWNSVGITKQPDYLYHEFMEITNYGNAEYYEKEGLNDVLEAKMLRPLDRKCCVHVSGAFRVGYQENIALVGQLSEESRTKLMEVAGRLIANSQAERL